MFQARINSQLTLCRSIGKLSVNEGILRICIIFHNSHRNTQLIIRTLHYASGNRLFLPRVLNSQVGSIYIYIYIYIYCHPQTDCFVLSELFSVVRYVGRSKPGSKPTQLYVRLSLRPLGQQAYHVWLRELLRYLCSNSSCRLFTFLYPIGYQSAQFFRRALHYASGGRKFLHQSAQPPYIYIYCHQLTNFCSIDWY